MEESFHTHETKRQLITKNLTDEINKYGLFSHYPLWSANQKEVSIDLSSLSIPDKFIQNTLSTKQYKILKELEELSGGYMSTCVFSKDEDTHFLIDYGYSFNIDELLALKLFLKYCTDEEKKREFGFKALLIEDEEIELSETELDNLLNYLEPVVDELVYDIECTINNRIEAIVSELHVFLKKSIDNVSKVVFSVETE